MLARAGYGGPGSTTPPQGRSTVLGCEGAPGNLYCHCSEGDAAPNIPLASSAAATAAAAASAAGVSTGIVHTLASTLGVSFNV